MRSLARRECGAHAKDATTGELPSRIVKWSIVSFAGAWHRLLAPRALSSGGALLRAVTTREIASSMLIGILFGLPAFANIRRTTCCVRVARSKMQYLGTQGNPPFFRATRCN